MRRLVVGLAAGFALFCCVAPATAGEYRREHRPVVVREVRREVIPPVVVAPDCYPAWCVPTIRYAPVVRYEHGRRIIVRHRR